MLVQPKPDSVPAIAVSFHSPELDKLWVYLDSSVGTWILKLRYSRGLWQLILDNSTVVTLVFFFLVVLNLVFWCCFEGKCILTKLFKFWEVLKTGIHVFGATFPKWISVPLGFVFFFLPSFPSMPFFFPFLFFKHPSFLTPCFTPTQFNLFFSLPSFSFSLQIKVTSL